eukprot:TRINITY_DN433_c2_g2_i1.p1 TRINITY_DN433_c2_g2~~TRINITY_DN433_c2_g2_i1.p1  ORF type:complete len:271 (-),score=42.14 TRINITY_DN433_c2_g2_i1:38-850(-)
MSDTPLPQRNRAGPVGAKAQRGRLTKPSQKSVLVVTNNHPGGASSKTHAPSGVSSASPRSSAPPTNAWGAGSPASQKSAPQPQQQQQQHHHNHQQQQRNVQSNVNPATSPRGSAGAGAKSAWKVRNPVLPARPSGGPTNKNSGDRTAGPDSRSNATKRRGNTTKADSRKGRVLSTSTSALPTRSGGGTSVIYRQPSSATTGNTLSISRSPLMAHANPQFLPPGYLSPPAASDPAYHSEPNNNPHQHQHQQQRHHHHHHRLQHQQHQQHQQ